MSDDTSGRRAALALTVLTSAMFIAVTTEVAPIGLLPQISRSAHVPEPIAGLLISVFAVVVAVSAVPLTLVSRRYPPKGLLIGVIVAYAVSDLVMAAGRTFALLCAARLLGGIAHALFFSVLAVYIPELVPPTRFGRGIATVWSGAPIAYLFGVPLTTAAGDRLGWRWSFGGLGAAAAILALSVAILLPAAAAGSRAITPSTTGWWRGGLLMVSLATALGFLGNYTLYTFITPLLLHSGVQSAAVGPALFVFGAFGLLGLWIAGRVVDRTPRRALLLVIALAVLAVFSSGVGTTADLTVVVVAAFCGWNLAFGSMPTLYTVASLRTDSASVAISAAVNNSVSNVGIGVGSLIGAATFGALGVPAVPYVAGSVLLLSLLVVARSRRAFADNLTLRRAPP